MSSFTIFNIRWVFLYSIIWQTGCRKWNLWSVATGHQVSAVEYSGIFTSGGGYTGVPEYARLPALFLYMLVLGNMSFCCRLAFLLQCFRIVSSSLSIWDKFVDFYLTHCSLSSPSSKLFSQAQKVEYFGKRRGIVFFWVTSKKRRLAIFNVHCMIVLRSKQLSRQIELNPFWARVYSET